ncbi:cation-binding protein [Bordetella genomosp. 8]|uniref:Cation-binding protein n=2 Tax=Bordetella genomosp. 8 TaxID=1416806 RepID=A0A1W6YRC0_9BORD|nr:cation-binding protein [Bordetella genomosp. 8]
MNATDLPYDAAHSAEQGKPLYRRLIPRATNMIRLDHTHVLTTFHRYHEDLPASRKAGLVGVICTALEIHATLEEEIFYPAVQAVTSNEVLNKSVPEHMEMRRLIADLRAMTPTDPRYDDTLMALMRDVIHHVADEETVVLPEAERLFSETRLQELGTQMTKRRLQLAAPRTPQIARDMARGMPMTTFTVGALAMLAVGCVIRAVR